MTVWAPIAVYSLCLLTSVICAALLLQAYRVRRSQLLLYTALGFGCLAINNLLLVADLVLLPQLDLWPFRQLALLAAISVLLYGFIFEVES